MKQFFTTLMMLVFAGNASSQVLSQNAIPNAIQNNTSVACFIPGSNNFTAANAYMRVFRLQDFGITSEFTITNVAFGVQNVSGTFPVNVRILNLNGQFPGGVGAVLDAANVNVAPANNLGMVSSGANLQAVIPAGGAFVINIAHNGNVNPRQRFLMGSHSAIQTGSSYLVAPACNINNPTATGTGPLANSPQAKWVMTVTGHSAVLGVTEVINSPEIQTFPNPVKDVLKFRFNNNLKSEGIDIYDMNGRVVTSIQNNKNVNEVNMSAYPKGNYILKVKANDGKLYVEKIIKE